MSFTLAHEDYLIISESPVSCEQYIDLDKQNKPIINLPTDESSSYQDYQPTALQFRIQSSQANQSMQLTIPFNHRLPKVEARHAILCFYDEAQGKWVKKDMNIDLTEQIFSANLTSIGLYAIFVNKYWYSTFTQNIADEFPHWTKIRSTKESNGQRFLNFFGVQFEEIKEYLDWIQEQKYIRTADIKQLDWVYAYALPPVKVQDTIQCFYQSKEIPILDTIREFFYNDRNEGGIIDYDEQRFYAVKYYEELTFNINGSTYTVKGIPFQIWNSLDEFGLLFNLKRLYLESNANFKERILDVFRYPANTSDEGLTNGIARELDMIQRITWEDDTKTLYLVNESALPIDIRSLRVDSQRLEEDQYEVDEAYNITIYPLNQNKSHTVSYICGIYKHELFNTNDEVLYKLMYQEDGQATPRFLNWVHTINMIAPVMWDHFRWDEGFWDTIDNQLFSVGYVPNMWDSNIDHWLNYTFNPHRWEGSKVWMNKG